jgi:hypothetical protein
MLASTDLFMYCHQTLILKQHMQCAYLDDYRDHQKQQLRQQHARDGHVHCRLQACEPCG